MDPAAQNPFRPLPAVEEVLADPAAAALAARVGRELLVRFVQEELARWREEIRARGLDAAAVRARLEGGELALALAARVRREEGSGIRRAVNAAGVVLHTGLGRAPVHPAAAQAMAEAAASYCVLEVDRFTGERNRRDDRLSALLARLTGAEAGLAVNNNAAAVLLLLNTFAAGRATVVSRGELVEIGGSFRMPDVMERAGTRLVEVGTTNRTGIDDYRRAAGPDTGLLLKVHTSNFRMEGFVAEVDPAALVALGRERGIPVAYDLGSGLLEAEGATPLAMLGAEPRVRAAVAAGFDAVTFSGDKLLGGPQAGLVAGRRAAIAELRANALYRALRLDKVAIAGLEKTLELLLAGRGDEIPARRMLFATADDLRPAAEVLAAAAAAIPGVRAEIAAGESQPGSGSAPAVRLPTWVVRVNAAGLGAEELAARLRAGEPPVFARIQQDELLLDPRTFLAGDLERVAAALRAAVEGAG
ncbi:MAG: L-seryl-tRNA(Sec) selenium transferase [Planctomycetota bacterium]